MSTIWHYASIPASCQRLLTQLDPLTEAVALIESLVSGGPSEKPLSSDPHALYLLLSRPAEAARIEAHVDQLS